MKIVVFVNTPAQAHFLKNIIRGLSTRGHSITVLSRDYGETLDVLTELGIIHQTYSRPKKSKISKTLSFPSDVLNAYKLLSKSKFDLVFGFGIIETYTGLLLRAPVLIFNDSEPMVNNFSFSMQFLLFMPFIEAIITPSAFRQDLGKKHIRVDSYKELAYLHPNYFKPNDDIFQLLGMAKGERYAILRFNAFDAVHDAGVTGFTDQDKIRLVTELEKSMKVLISSESKLPGTISDRVMKIPKNRIHDALYFSQLLVTDTQTMATEAALLGVPTVRCNKFVGINDMGNFTELEKKYGLLYNFLNQNEAIDMALSLASKKNIKAEWQFKKTALITEKTDITQFMIKFIEKLRNSSNDSDKLKR